MPLNQPLNRILYGPPGTGKTYKTRRLAVAIIDGEDKVKGYKDEKLKKRYEELRTAGRIVFTTFHQSLGYEEFVEGIKPKIQKAPSSLGADEHPTQSADQIQYEIQDGIFKTVTKDAKKALQNTLPIPHKELLKQEPVVWKIALGREGKFKQECFKNNRIAIGWNHFGDLNDEDNYKEYQKGKTESSVNNFCKKMKIGDLCIVYQQSAYRAAKMAAVGVIKGKYEYDAVPKINKRDNKTGEVEEYKHTREVEWLWVQSDKNDFIDIYKINNRTALGQATCYRTSINAAELLNMTQDKLKKEGPRNYVLIIDEINRGNISKILGELITLIEDNKRLGEKEEMKVMLPYSKQEFGVPNNLYIIGTMNTADRSIAFLDTALRRRFSFIEMMPKYGVLEEELDPIDGIDIFKMLEAMNKQITEQHDRDHQIGHSYFLRLKESPEPKIDALANIFKHEIIPLLHEYFHDDTDKIEKVLNGKELLKEGTGLDEALKKATNYQKIYENSNTQESGAPAQD